MRKASNMTRASLLLALFLLFSGCDMDISVNKDVTIPAGSRHKDGVTSVNGNIRVESDAVVNGPCTTVNGRIDVSDNSQVEELTTVNGRIRLGENVVVDGEVTTVNGGVRSGRNTEIRAGINTVNGDVDLAGTRCARNIETVNGNITLSEGAVVEHDVIIGEVRGDSDKPRKITIRLSGGSIVKGNIEVQDRSVEARVILSEGSRVEGEIIDAEVVQD